MAYSLCRSLVYTCPMLATLIRAFVHDVSSGLASLVRLCVDFVFVCLRMPGVGNTDACLRSRCVLGPGKPGAALRRLRLRLSTWEALDFARLNHSTVSFYDDPEPETAASRWNRVSLNASKVGQGLSKDAKALKLAFQHWIEAIDPRHRYGHNLHFYYDAWCQTQAGQPFFYWLDIGEGKDIELPECSRALLKKQCIRYLGPVSRAKTLTLLGGDGAHGAVPFLKAPLWEPWGRVALVGGGRRRWCGPILAWICVRCLEMDSRRWRSSFGVKVASMAEAPTKVGTSICSEDGLVVDGGDDTCECVRPVCAPDPQEREYYEYIIKEGKIVHKISGEPLDTSQGSKGTKWIFVMSTAKKLYAGQKERGVFQHSSFLAGGATIAAGRFTAENGVIKSIWAYSGHYKPSAENLTNFMSFLEENGVDLKEVEVRSSTKEDYYEDPVPNIKENPAAAAMMASNTPQLKLPSNMVAEDKASGPSPQTEADEDNNVRVEQTRSAYQRTLSGGLQSHLDAVVSQDAILERVNSKSRSKSYQLGHRLSLKWSTGNGPRIGCVKDYPIELRMQALEMDAVQAAETFQ
ncbi:hypothetical protein TRIUR3_31639 [Triticum urartu]|uniref:IQ domain-containing protein IQM3 n=1 Tax=Triticum urartu TaxID=4572 RepID=M8A2S8_TRIUA|nr:hypothetical protein TRIUR3_31639 [Triticum urartu]